MLKTYFILIAFVAVSCLSATAQVADYKAIFTSAPQRVPTSKTPDAPLAGNGDIGLTLGGKPDRLTLYFGKNDFWRAYPVYPGGGVALPGGLHISIAELDGATYYAEQVLEKGIIEAEFKAKNIKVDLDAWVAATHNSVVIEISANRACKVNLQLWAKEGNTSLLAAGNSGDVKWVSRSFEKTALVEWPTHVALAMKTVGAELEQDQWLKLKPGKKTWVTITLVTNHDHSDWLEEAINSAKAMNAKTIQRMKSEHLSWWKQFWQGSHIAIGDTTLEKYYYGSQYLFACSSRAGKFAPGIWGPFVTQDSTAWGGDYHLNYNYQAPYWASYSSNHLNQVENYDQPLLDYMAHGRAHAMERRHTGGLYYPVGIGPKGLVTTRWPLTAEEMKRRYGTTENTIDGGLKFLGQKINAVFGVGNMLMRFYSTYDKDYAQKIYPYMLGCADFWEDYLAFEKGRYVIYMDHYNEVMPNLKNKGQWRDQLGDVNSTLSLGLVKMLFKGIIDVSIFLNEDEARRKKWQHILTHLSGFPLGELDGRPSLKNVETSPSAHQSQARGLKRVSIHGLILPGGVAGPLSTPELNTILLGDVAHWKEDMDEPGTWGNTLGNGVETCFPGAVRVGYDNEEILKQLKDRIAVDAYPNLWINAAGGGIETLAAVPLTINEMLLQSYEGTLRLFPNWNRQKDASFVNLRAYGAFLVSASLKNKHVTSLRLFSEKGRNCKMENPWRSAKVQLTRNGRKAEVLSGDLLQFETIKNESVELMGVD